MRRRTFTVTVEFDNRRDAENYGMGDADSVADLIHEAGMARCHRLGVAVPYVTLDVMARSVRSRHGRSD